MSWSDTFRDARGSLTQEQAAAACGYSVQAVRHWEQELRTPHPRAQVGILAALRSATKLALHQSADKTAMELGHQGSTKMLFRHYKATVTKEDAAIFWQLEPVVLLTVVKEKVA